jgi:hypothetical protein
MSVMLMTAAKSEDVEDIKAVTIQVKRALFREGML